MADEKSKLDLNRDFQHLLERDDAACDAEFLDFIEELILILFLGGLL